MISQYYDLKDAKHLPTGAKFVDPVNNQIYFTTAGESLTSFLSRIETSRAEKNIPEISRENLELLVITSFVENATPDVLAKYFHKKPVPVKMEQLISLARTIANNHSKRNNTSFIDRQRRASQCTSCRFHQKSGLMSPVAVKMLNALSGLEEVEQSMKEKSLGTCGMCGCALQAKIRFPVKGMLAGLTPENIGKLVTAYGPRAFSVCWMLSESLDSPDTRRLLEAKLKVVDKQTGNNLGTAFLTAHDEEKNQATRSSSKDT